MEYSVKQACPTVFLLQASLADFINAGHRDDQCIKLELYKSIDTCIWFHICIFNALCDKNVLVVKKSH